MPAPKFTPKDVGLTSPSFTAITSSEVTRRAILNIEGDSKGGKSDLSIRTFPDPIVIFNFDQGLEHVVEKQVKKGKKIIVAGSHKLPGTKYPSYHFAKPAPDKGEKQKSESYLTRIKGLAYPIWNKFITDYTEALESKHIRTLVIDTGGAAFQLGKFAFMGMDKYTSKDDPYGQKGGEMKSIFQGLICDGYNYDKNVLWIHRLKEEWAGGQPAGTYKADGYAQIAFEVQSTIRIRTIGKGDKLRRVGEIRNNRIGQGSAQNGMKFGEEGGPPLDFPTIMATLTGEDEGWD